MKAFVSSVYGPPEVLKLREVEKPSPGENDVLIRNCATSVNAYDWHMMQADPWFVRLMGGGFFKPKITILGADVAGVVEAVGSKVTLFQPGNEVFGDVSGRGGGFGQYSCAREHRLARKPANVSFEEAAAAPLAAITALQGLRDKGGLRAGQEVLINGASGGVGTFAVQLATTLGAEVTAVCSTRNVEQARSLGADHVIDYTNEDFAKSGKQYDLIFAANGNRSVREYGRALKDSGRFVLAGGTMGQMYSAMFQGPLLSMLGSKKFIGYVARPSQDDITYLAELLEAGKIRSVVEMCYPFEELPDALRYVDAGHARGKIVVTMQPTTR